MKKQKLSLQELKVESFVTEVKPDRSTVKGGVTPWAITLSIATIIRETMSSDDPDPAPPAPDPIANSDVSICQPPTSGMVSLIL